MKAKKALKKIEKIDKLKRSNKTRKAEKLQKKLVKKLAKQSLKQLKQAPLKALTCSQDTFTIEFDLTQPKRKPFDEATINAFNALIAPSTAPATASTSAHQATTVSRSTTHADNVPNVATPNIQSLAYLPLKSPPCKRCPALRNGICKCAMKKYKLSA